VSNLLENRFSKIIPSPKSAGKGITGAGINEKCPSLKRRGDAHAALGATGVTPVCDLNHQLPRNPGHQPMA